jgi:hypothetical protein
MIYEMPDNALGWVIGLWLFGFGVLQGSLRSAALPKTFSETP